MEVKRKDVVRAADELNEVLGLDPVINTSQSLSTVKNLLLEAADLIVPEEDDVSEKTMQVIQQLRESEQGEQPVTEQEPEEQEAVEEVVEEQEQEAVTVPTDSDTQEQPKSKAENPGVIASIVSIIEEAGRTGVSKDEILQELGKRFPDRDPERMKKTVNTQVPTRINKEKFPIEKVENRFRKK